MSNLPTTAKEKITGLMRLIESRKEAFQELLPKYLTPERLFRIANLAFSKQPLLLGCTPASVLLALMDAARAGLEPNGQDAALVPYGNQCQYQPMFRGLIKKAVGDGAAKKIEARVVYANDRFRLWFDPEPHIEHEPAYEDEGEVVGAYAYAILPDDSLQVEFMNKRKLDHIRAKAKSKSGPWLTDEEEMYRKTPVKRLFKYLPTSDRLEYAVALDNQIETGKPRVDIPLLEEPPPDLKEPAKTATETLEEKIKRGRKPKETLPENTGGPISSGPEGFISPVSANSSPGPIMGQKGFEPISTETLERIDMLCMETNSDGSKILTFYGVPTLEDLSEEQGLEAIELLKKKQSVSPPLS